MLIYDAEYAWEGWGGKLRLASGKCRLRIYDRSKGKNHAVAFLKPYIVIVSDLPESKMSVRSCAGHIATHVTREFHIDPERMMWIEYYPEITYGAAGDRSIPEQYVAVDFIWHEDKAIHPRWRPLTPSVLEVIKSVMDETGPR